MKNKTQLTHIGLIILSLFMFGVLFIFNMDLMDKLLGSGLNIIGIYGILGFVIIFEMLLFSMIYNIAKQVRDNQKPFDFLRKRNPIEETQIFLMALKNLPYDYPIQQVTNGIDIDVQGEIMEIRFLKGEGLLKGHLKDDIWTLEGKEIANPFVVKKECYLVRESQILYQVDPVFVGSISQIIFKIENQLLNRKSN